MLASARSSCARTFSLSRPAWSLALPAESSRQAAVRARLHAGTAAFVRPVHGGTKAPYSAAAAAVAEQEQDDEYEIGHSEPLTAQRQVSDQAQGNKSAGYGEWIRDQDAGGSGRFSMPSNGSENGSRRGVQHGADEDTTKAAAIEMPAPPDSMVAHISDVSDPTLDPFLSAEAATPPRTSRAPSPPLPTSIHQLPPLLQFRSTLSSHPHFALRVFGDMSTADLHRLTLLEYDTFLHSLSRSFGSQFSPRKSIADEELRSLVRLHAALREYKDAQYTEEGEAIHGKRLVRLMRACMLLGAPGVFKSVWKGRLADVRRGEAVVGEESDRIGNSDEVDRTPHNAFPGANALNQIAEDLVKARHWELARWLFDASQMRLEWYTPNALEAAVRTAQAYDEPEAIVRLCDEAQTRKLRYTPDVYCTLMQAYLQLGNVDLARATLARGEKDREMSNERVQIGIMRGHMVLGGSSAVAERVMKDIASLKIAPTARLLNTLIRARLQDRDHTSALQLLANFDFAGGETEATAETYALTLRLHAQSSDIANLRNVWHRLVSAGIVIDSQHLLVVVNALGQAGPAQAEEALQAVRAHIDQTPFTAWRIPPKLELSVGVMNTLLHSMSRHHGLAGVERVLRLMRRARLPANDDTVQILVSLITDVSKSPVEGIALLTQLRDRLPGIRATSDTLDKALASALASYKRSTSAITTSPISADPHAGIKTSGPFQRAIGPVLQSLQARQARSTSTTLAHRLQFEALTQSTATQSGVPDVRHVWTQMLARGYEPSEEHILGLVKGYARAGAMKQAEETLNLAEEQDITETPGMWMELLNGWAEKGQIGKAEMAYRQICNLGDAAKRPESQTIATGRVRAFAAGQPDLVAMTAMVRAYYVCGSYRKAREMVMSLMERFPQLDSHALLVAVHALRLDNRPLTALHLVRKQTTALSTPLRRVIKQIRKYAYRTAAKNANPSASTLASSVTATPAPNAMAPSRSYEMSSSYDFTASAADRAKIFHLATELLKRDDEERPANQRKVMSAKTMRDRIVRAATDDGKRRRSTRKGRVGKEQETGSEEIVKAEEAGSEALETEDVSPTTAKVKGTDATPETAR